jgi:hypothetical protein
MKKFLFVLAGIVAYSLLTPPPILAEPTHPNEVGLYTTPDAYGETGTFDIGIPVDVYLVLTKPTDMICGMPYSAIRAFECLLNFNPSGGIFLLGEVLPPGSIDIGDNNHIEDGFLEYIVGTADDWPVIDESVVLIQFTFMNINTSVVEVTLGPTFSPCIPGEMAFVSYEYEEPYHCTIMHPVSGSLDAPVFIFNGMAFFAETESFGSVKALYR